jgi:hypothetical protein
MAFVSRKHLGKGLYHRFKPFKSFKRFKPFKALPEPCETFAAALAFSKFISFDRRAGSLRSDAIWSRKGALA